MTTTTSAFALTHRKLWLLVAALVAVHYILALTAVSRKGNTFDELAHLTAGYSHWRTGDFRLVPEHPPLPSAWAALPLRFMSLQFPKLDQPAWWNSNQWSIGSEFFFGVGNNPARMLLASRAVVLVFSSLTAILVFLGSRSLWGNPGGLISLALFVFCPTMLANGPLVTTDTASGFFFLVAAGAIWWSFQIVRPASVIISGLALAGLFLTKMSSFLMGPIYAILLAYAFLSRRELRVGLRKPRSIHKPIARMGVHAGVAFAQSIIMVLSIWAAYGFRYSAFVNAEPARDRFAVRDDSPQSSQSSWDEELAKVGGVPADIIGFARDHRLLPEAYLYGLAFTLDMTQGRDAFLNGQRSREGFWSFFPLCFLYKTPLAVFAMLMVAGTAAYLHRKKQTADTARAALAPLMVLIVVYGAAAVASRFNIGHRHLLPIYPPLFILAGASARLWQSRRSGRVAICGVLAAHAVVSIWTWPDYLAYFNLFAGGSRNGYRHLVDSSLDWGQDLPALASRLGHIDPSHERRRYLAYWGTDSPEFRGIRMNNLLLETGASTLPVPLQGGDYFISASRLQQLEVLPISRWTPKLESLFQENVGRVRTMQRVDPVAESAQSIPDEMLVRLRFARLCSSLRRREPDGSIGGSILAFRLTDDDIRGALLGPPAESVADSAEDLLRLGDELAIAGAAKHAQECYREAIKIESTLAAAHEHLGTLLFQAGDLADAEKHLNEALTLEPESPGAAFNLGQILLSRGKGQEGFEMLRKAAALRPDWPATHLILAGLWESQGRQDMVIRELEEAVRLDPRLDQARQALERIKAHR